MNNEQIPPYSLSRMTGCTKGKVPQISLEKALAEGHMVKAVYLDESWPLYASIVGIDYGSQSFDMEEANGNRIDNLPWNQYVIFSANPIQSDIPKKVESAIIINGEIFTVVNDDTVPIWVGNDNLIYYCEDIQALVEKYGYSTLLD